MEAGEKIELAKLLLDKAEKHLKAAKLLKENGYYEDALSRAYYAVFSSSSAVLTLLGHSARSHEGLRRMFGLYVINQGLLPRKYGKILSNLYEKREAGDYEVPFMYEPEDVEESIKEAEDFITTVKTSAQELISKIRRNYSVG